MRWSNPQTATQLYINTMGNHWSPGIDSTKNKSYLPKIKKFPFAPNNLVALESLPNNFSAELSQQLKLAIGNPDFECMKAYLGPHTELKYRQYAQRYLERLREWSSFSAKLGQWLTSRSTVTGQKRIYHRPVYDRTVNLFFRFIEYQRIWREFKTSFSQTTRYQELFPLYQQAEAVYANQGLTAYFEKIDSNSIPQLKDFFIQQWDAKHPSDEELTTEKLSEDEGRLFLAIFRQEFTHPNEPYQPSTILSDPLNNVSSYQGIVIVDEMKADHPLNNQDLSWEERFLGATHSPADAIEEWLTEIRGLIESTQRDPILIYDAIYQKLSQYTRQCIQVYDSQKPEAIQYEKEITQIKTAYESEAQRFFQRQGEGHTTQEIIQTGIGSTPLDDIEIEDPNSVDSTLVPLMYAVTASYAQALHNYSRRPALLETYTQMGAWLIQRGALLASPKREQNAFEYAQLPASQIPNSWLEALGNSLSSPTTEIYSLQKLLTGEISYKISWIWLFGLIFRLTHNEQETSATIVAIMSGQRTLYHIEQQPNQAAARQLIGRGRSIFYLPQSSQPLLIKGYEEEVEMRTGLLTHADSVI